MNDIVKGVDSKTRVLVASIAGASDVTALAAQVGPFSVLKIIFSLS